MKTYSVAIHATFEAESDEQARAQALALSVVTNDSGDIADSDIASLTVEDDTDAGPEERVLYQEGGPFLETEGYLSEETRELEA